MRNIRIEKANLRRFFTHIYSAKIAAKLITLFDFSMPVDYKIFYKQLQEQVVCQHKLDVDMVELAKKFAFTIFDMNSDGSVD